MIHEDDTDGGLLQNVPEKSVSNYGGSVGWVTDSNAPTQGWDSESSTDYVVMSVWRRQEEELKIAGAKLALRINDHATQAWIDSGLPISIFTIRELKSTSGTCNVRLQQLDPKDDQFRDYGNNPLKFSGQDGSYTRIQWMENKRSHQCYRRLQAIYYRPGFDARAGIDVGPDASGAGGA